MSRNERRIMDIKKLIIFVLILLTPFINYSMEMSPERRLIFVLKAEIGDLKERIVTILEDPLAIALAEGKSAQDLYKEINDKTEQIRNKIAELRKRNLENFDVEFIKAAEAELEQKLQELKAPARAEEKKEKTILDLFDELYDSILAETQYDRLAEQEEDEVEKEEYQYKRDRAQKRKDELESELKEITKNFSEQMYSSLQNLRKLLQQRNDFYDLLYEQSKKRKARKNELQSGVPEKEGKIILASIKRLKENMNEDRRQVEALNQKIGKLGNELQKMMGVGEKKEAAIKKPVPKGEKVERKPVEIPIRPEFRVAGAPKTELERLRERDIINAQKEVNTAKSQLDLDEIYEKLNKEIPNLDEIWRKLRFPAFAYPEMQEGEEVEEEFEWHPVHVEIHRPPYVEAPSGNLIDLLTDLRNRLRTMKSSFGR